MKPPEDLPDDLPLVERNVVRVVVLDADHRILLFCIREPLYPEQGTAWELPGGGLDPGESHGQAAQRELREETGILVQPRDIASPTWHRQATFRHAGVRRLQNEAVVLVRLPYPGPAVDDSEQLADEKETYLGFRWWPVAEIETSSERFYPSRLPTLVRCFLDGEPIEEPFEHFS